MNIVAEAAEDVHLEAAERVEGLSEAGEEAAGDLEAAEAVDMAEESRAWKEEQMARDLKAMKREAAKKAEREGVLEAAERADLEEAEAVVHAAVEEDILEAEAEEDIRCIT